MRRIRRAETQFLGSERSRNRILTTAPPPCHLICVGADYIRQPFIERQEEAPTQGPNDLCGRQLALCRCEVASLAAPTVFGDTHTKGRTT
jgi:hypothetical protein